MTRRFWIGARAGAAGVRARDGRPSRRTARLDRSDAVELDPARPRDAGRAVGRLAVLRARLAVAGDAQPQHVHADRDGHRRRLCLQRGRDARAADLSRRPSAATTARSRSISKRRRSSPCWCCSARCWSCARASRRRARSGRCSTSRRRPRAASMPTAASEDVALDARRGRRSAARASRREGAGRRRRRRRPLVARRVDGHRRIDAGHQGGRRQGDRRHAQPDRQLRHARRQGRPRHAAGADRADGRARRSARARRSSAWPTRSPAGSCRP